MNYIDRQRAEKKNVNLRDNQILHVYFPVLYVTVVVRCDFFYSGADAA